MARQYKILGVGGRLLLAAFVIAMSLAGWHLLFGKLLVYSPVTIGFQTIDLQHLELRIENGATFTETWVDTLVKQVETFHGMTFKRKPRVFIFANENSFHRYSLSQARFCAYYNGDIVAAPRSMTEARAGDISLSIYLRHELSHSLLFQNTDILHRHRLPKWLLEGTAMYSAGQMGTSIYPSGTETYNLIRQGHFMPPEIFRTKAQKQYPLDVANPIAFLYSEFGCIAEYLDTTHGRDKFRAYLQALVSGASHEQVFTSVYHISFNEFIHEFLAHVRT